MRRLLQLLSSMSRYERWALGVFGLLFVFSLGGALRSFYIKNTILVPASGGTYIEGSVGVLAPLNPWFTVTNDVNRDIVSLVFSGLMKYNPKTKKVEEDLATMQAAKDGRVYTLKLKENLFWHDSTPEAPHPVTADDVVFTFRTIQDPQFPNLILQQNFRGVTIAKLDQRTVRFELTEPYSFFPSNLTLGLVPQKSFEGIPVSKLDQELDFGFHPVGAGPYRVKTIVQTDLSSEITLERFERAIPPGHRLERVVFRIFSDYSTLLSDLRNLQGVRLVTRSEKGEPIIPRRFTAREYNLPQYVALFFNLQRPQLQDQKLRLGLQLGTNKQEVTDAVHEPIIVDTPLLEIDTSDWRYKFDSAAAQGSLFASRWNLPEKVRLQHLLELEEANGVGALKAPPVAYLPGSAVLTLTGSTQGLPPGAAVNGVRVDAHPTQSGAWIVNLSAAGSGAALKPGENLLRLTDSQKKILDSFYVTVYANEAEYRRALEERALVLQFLRSKGRDAAADQRIASADFTLDRGMLRRRKPGDTVSVRVNERGEPLRITLLTSNSPPSYKEVALDIKRQWEKLGVEVKVEIPASRGEFQDRLQKREYDVVLFGQSLLDNLDSYPYWHSSGVQKITGQAKDLRLDAYNLSQYSSFEADALLESVRRTADEKERTQSLQKLRDVLKNDVPAIFLYSPEYTFAHHQNILGVELGTLSLHSDRFLTLHDWYVKQERIFRPNDGWFRFPLWLFSLLK